MTSEGITPSSGVRSPIGLRGYGMLRLETYLISKVFLAAGMAFISVGCGGLDSEMKYVPNQYRVAVNAELCLLPVKYEPHVGEPFDDDMGVSNRTALTEYFRKELEGAKIRTTIGWKACPVYVPILECKMTRRSVTSRYLPLVGRKWTYSGSYRCALHEGASQTLSRVYSLSKSESWMGINVGGANTIAVAGASDSFYRELVFRLVNDVAAKLAR